LVVSQRASAQLAQAAPAAPHWPPDWEEYGTQVVPLQQPPGQDVASHTHRPLVVSHSWPTAHAAHMLAVPQAALDSEAYGTHVLPLQHPWGHEVASQTQCPLRHSCPIAQEMHAAPAEPHDVSDSLESGSHVPALQQPVQEVPPHVQVPFEHASLTSQALQVPPPVPHALADCDEEGTQEPPLLQHPLGHDVESQTHRPFVVSHRWPVGEHPPHAAPPVPHEEFDWDANGSHKPVAPPLQQPFGQLFPLHSHSPLVVSQRPLGHGLHAPPPSPHSTTDCEAEGMQWPAALQQPPAHVAGPHGPDASFCAPAASPPFWPSGGPASSPPTVSPFAVASEDIPPPSTSGAGA
jgi:hypothetical protein